MVMELHGDCKKIEKSLTGLTQQSVDKGQINFSTSDVESING